LAQTFDILLLVSAMPTWRTLGFGYDSEPFGQPEVAYGNTELFGDFRYRECVSAVHILIEKLIGRFR
jgi:hypothetical protein